MESFARKYKSELLENVIPFWEHYSIDHDKGGYFTCLERDGRVFDTDKFMWLQGRQIWTMSTLYAELGEKESWKSIAEHGVRFILDHGRDAARDCYFALDRSGNPLVQPYNIFSDCFATMGLASLYKITHKDEYGQVALDSFNSILARQKNSKVNIRRAIQGHAI